MDHTTIVEAESPKLTPEFSIKISVGYLTSIIGSIIVAVLFIYSLRNDVITLLKTVATQQELLGENQKTIISMQITINDLTQRFTYFQSLYEYDRAIKIKNER